MASVFIVEDEPVVLYAFKRGLERLGLAVCGTAMDGREALQGIDSLKSPPDVVLMDHRLPNMSGLEATKHLLKRDPEMCILFVSADNTVKKEALKAGARDFLEKPVLSDQLVECIRDHCRG